VDAMKELPATLLLRPFGFDTLATAVFTLASLDKLEDSAVPALPLFWWDCCLLFFSRVACVILPLNSLEPHRNVHS
jgi:iron(III) transport system permease protein